MPTFCGDSEQGGEAAALAGDQFTVSSIEPVWR